MAREKQLFSLLVCITFIITLLMALPYSIVKANDLSPEFEKLSIDPEIGAVHSIIQDHYGYREMMGKILFNQSASY